MSLVSTDNANYYDIANAIRAKLSVATTFKPDQMAAAVRSIPVGDGHCQKAAPTFVFHLENMAATWPVTAAEYTT